MGIFTQPVVLSMAVAAIGLLVAVLSAGAFWAWRRRTVLRHLRRYDQVEFTPGGIQWTDGGTAAEDAVPLFLIMVVPVVIGGAVLAGAFAIMVALAPKASWQGTMVVAYAGLCGGGYYLLRWLREEWEGETRQAASVRREQIARQTAAVFGRLQTIGEAIGELGAAVGLKLSSDYAAEAAAVFRSLTQRYREHSDRSLIRGALAITERRLLRQKTALTEAVALYWEALAALAEADVAGGGDAATGERLLRRNDLKERLFAPGLLELLKTGWAAGSAPLGDFLNIVTAILREAQALTAAAPGGEAGGERLPFFDGPMSETEAAAVFGVGPEADGREIAGLYASLLELWDGEDPESQARRQELTNAYAVLQRKGSA